MSFFPWFKRSETKASQGATRSVYIDSLTNDFLTCSLTGEVITPQKAFRIYRQNAAAATAVDMIADEFEKITPVLELSDGTIVDKAPVLDFLKNPNPYMDWSGFASKHARHYLLTRQSFFYAMGTNTLPPQEMYPVRPTYISTETVNDEYVNTFHSSFGVSGGSFKAEQTRDRVARYYSGPLRELYRISGFSSMSTDGTADSPLQAAALETEQQLKGKVHNVQMLDNGGRMSLLIIFKDAGGIKDDEMRERLQQLNEKFAGPENAGRIGAMEGSEIEDVREMGVTQKDMDWSTLNDTAGRAIYFRYKIPLPLITTDASSFNNMGTGVDMLYDFAVLPLTDKSFSGLSRFLLPRFGYGLNDARITYNPDSIKTLKERRLKELIDRKNIGIETTNEMRESLPNRDPVENGDVIYQNASLVPMGVDINDDGGTE